MTTRNGPRPGITLAAVVLLSAVACSDGGSSSPAGPSSSGSSSGLTGSWAGTASDSSGPGQMTWQLTQSGGSFTGSMTLTDTATKLTGRGTVSGSVSDSTMHFTIAIPAGGFDAPYNSCHADASGDGQISGNSITGTYAGSSSCGGTITSGQISLTKQ